MTTATLPIGRYLELTNARAMLADLWQLRQMRRAGASRHEVYTMNMTAVHAEWDAAAKYYRACGRRKGQGK